MVQASKSERPVIEARGLVKRYGAVTAIDGLDLTIGAGEVFGLLGPNGSGKTTTILLLLGLTECNAGSVRVLGWDPLRNPLQVKRRVGYLPDSVGFYDHLSGRSNLRYTARLAAVPRSEIDGRIAVALERVGLTQAADKRVAGYSRGMRQRLGLAEVLVKEAQIAILDEPTGGLDPHVTHEFLEMIRRVKRDGVTVLLSSHLLERVQTICDRVALFHHGRIALEGRVTDLAREILGGAYIVRVKAEGEGLRPRLRTLPGVTRVEADGEDGFRVEATRDLRPEVAAAVVDAGGRLLRLSVAEPNLDEVYTQYFREVSHVESA